MSHRWNTRSLVVALISFAVLSAQAAPPTAPQAVERFKVYGDGDALLVPVELGGTTHTFLVDTGASVTCIDRSLLSGKPIKEAKGRTASGITTLAAFLTPSATLGKNNLQAELPYVVALDLSTIRAVSGHDIRGILGMDFLHKRVVEINFDEGELVLRSEVATLDTTIKPLKLDFKKSIPYVQGRLPGWGKIQLALDTGCIDHGSGTLESRVCDYLVRKGNAKIVGSTLFTSASATDSSQELQCDSVILGGHAAANPIFKKGVKGLNYLSLHYLSRFHVTFDFPNKRLYLRPGNSFHRLDQKVHAGLHLLKQENGFAVHSVDSQSAAEKAGIVSGDVILQIDAQKISHLRSYELPIIFGKPGATYRVTLARGESILDVMMELEDDTKAKEVNAERRSPTIRLK